jgi:hypothetical protein
MQVEDFNAMKTQNPVFRQGLKFLEQEKRSMQPHSLWTGSLFTLSGVLCYLHFKLVLCALEASRKGP